MNPPLNDLAAAIDARKEDAIALLQELIAIATPNPPGSNYEEITALLRARFEEAGVRIEKTYIPTDTLRAHGIDGETYPRPALLGRYGDLSGPSLHLHGHFDVVPANDPVQYIPIRESGRVRGRGSSDMKAGLVAMWAALLALQDCGRQPNRPITLSLTPDEESGGETGAGYLIREGVIQTDSIAFLIMPECTSTDIWNASKGALVVDVVVRGKPAHSTLPHLGRNAFEDMLPVGQALVELRKRIETRQSGFSVDDPQAAFSTMAIGGEGGGGEKFNIIPGHYHFTIDRRPIPGEQMADVREELFAVQEDMRKRGIDVTFETLLEAESSLTPEDESGCRILTQAIDEVTGRKPRALLCPGFLDIRHFNSRGVPAVACGPGRLEVAHGPEEWVAERELIDYVQILALAMLRI